MYFEDRKTSGSFAAMLVPLRGTIVIMVLGLGFRGSCMVASKNAETYTPTCENPYLLPEVSCNHHIPMEPDTSEKEYALNHVRVPGLM